ncbi:MAG TPA: class I SAM-dependent methyltransferase, partial [Arenicellales bacterium]|nr:class I SAM-dependent methyltransferase [Arenicellales bacterium]
MSTDDHDSLVRRQFGASAERYRTSASHARGPSLDRLLALTAAAANGAVLDVATGAGHVAAALAPRSGLVVAADLTREMLDQTAVLCRERSVDNVHLVLESAQALAHPDGAFDLVTCRVAAHHFPSPECFVSESARVLKPGGILALVDNVVPDSPAVA